MPKKPFIKKIDIMQSHADSLLKDLLDMKTPLSYCRENVWYPPTDVVETDDEFIVIMEIPGVEKKDIDINLAAGILSIRGLRTHKSFGKPCKYHRVEIFCGHFKQEIAIGHEIDGPKISASCVNGLLELLLPKKKISPSGETKIRIENVT